MSRQGGRARVRRDPDTNASLIDHVYGPVPSPFVFSYGGYVEKDWPPNARTANPVSC